MQLSHLQHDAIFDVVFFSILTFACWELIHLFLVVLLKLFFAILYTYILYVLQILVSHFNSLTFKLALIFITRSIRYFLFDKSSPLDVLYVQYKGLIHGINKRLQFINWWKKNCFGMAIVTWMHTLQPMSGSGDEKDATYFCSNYFGYCCCWLRLHTMSGKMWLKMQFVYG